MPWTAADGHIKGILREPLGELGSGSEWSATMKVVFEYGVYVMYCSYSIGLGAGVVSGSDCEPQIGTGGDPLPDVLATAMEWAINRIENQWPKSGLESVSRARRFVQVTESEWDNVRKEDVPKSKKWNKGGSK